MEKEVEKEVEVAPVELGGVKHPVFTVEAAVETAQPKRKSSGGKKKGKRGKGKDLPNTGSPTGADRGAPHEEGKGKGVIETTHSVLPQRTSQKKKKGE